MKSLGLRVAKDLTVMNLWRGELESSDELLGIVIHIGRTGEGAFEDLASCQSSAKRANWCCKPVMEKGIHVHM